MPPVDDFGFIDVEPVVVVGGEARHVADGTVDVEDVVAPSTDQMVVVVPHPILVAGRRTGGLDPTDQIMFEEDAERVVDRLA